MDTQAPFDPSAPPDKGRAAKPRRRAATKPAEPSKRSLNLRVDVDTYERLTVHAMKRSTTISDLVMELARMHLREFSVHRIGVKGEGQGA